MSFKFQNKSCLIVIDIQNSYKDKIFDYEDFRKLFANFLSEIGFSLIKINTSILDFKSFILTPFKKINFIIILIIKINYRIFN